MTDVRSLKMQAVDCRHYIERLLSLFADFQAYAEEIIPIAQGHPPGPNLLGHYEKFRLSFQEYKNIFLECDDEGDRIINPGIAQIFYHADELRDRPEEFEVALLLATRKFQHLISNEERQLRELHDKIEVLSSEAEADKVAAIDTSVVERLRGMDDVAERGYTWLGRIKDLLPWAQLVIGHLRN